MSELTRLRSAVEQRVREVERRTGEARAIAKQGKEVEAAVSRLESARVAAEEAVEVLASLSDKRQDDLQREVEGLVTEGLRTVFADSDIEFRMVPTRRGRVANVDLLVRSKLPSGEYLETSVMDARGGGLAAVTGFLLRLVVLLLTSGARPLLVLDETFANLSAEYEVRMAEFLRDLVDKAQAQVLLVTHSDAYAESADKVYRMALEDGVSKIEALS